MAVNSTCVKCGSSSFEMAETAVRDSAYRLMFVRCASCGGAVAAIDFLNIGQQTKDILATLKQLQNEVRSLRR